MLTVTTMELPAALEKSANVVCLDNPYYQKSREMMICGYPYERNMVTPITVAYNLLDNILIVKRLQELVREGLICWSGRRLESIDPVVVMGNRPTLSQWVIEERK
ncbi:MAG: hypothetical protein NZU63_09660 [Gemmataceae bacterium]|nr:hypothetical protein [Gemmataceae bacterium]MDW8243709.1 hypothetical protein [Thermogemmata sp.]